MRAGLILLIFSWAFSKNDFFPISGYLCDRLDQADSCHINTVLFYCGTNWAWLDSVFKVAKKLNMKVILATAAQPHDTQAHNLQRFSGGQYSTYESESAYYTHDLGAMINDPSASGGKAWAVSSYTSGWLQGGPLTDEQFIYWTDSLIYYAYFRIKTNNTGTTYPLCKIYVRIKNNSGTELKAVRVITGNDFTRAGMYEDLQVPFKMFKYDKGNINFDIRYLGTNDSFYCDKIEVRDAVADSLYRGELKIPIQQIAKYFYKKPPLYRFYLWDEPNPNQFYASGEVNRLLKEQTSNKGGIQQVNRRGDLGTYLKSAKTDELFIDPYPLIGKERWEGRTPVDSGILFQQRLDNDLCKILGEARNDVKLHPGTNLWLSTQAFGNPRTDSTFSWKPIWKDSIPYADEGRWREPTLRELRCMIWLALAYGVKGVCHFLYPSEKEYFFNSDSNQEQYYWCAGLTTPKNCGSEKRWLWYAIRDINRELENIGPTLMNLISDTVFKTSDGIPTNCFIKGVITEKTQDTLIQIGTFHKEGNPDDKYFIIVNRHCLPQETIKITVGINEPIRLYDFQTKKTLLSKSEKSSPTFDFKIDLLPGQGKLFKIIKKQ